jgi:hypothetical protein
MKKTMKRRHYGGIISILLLLGSGAVRAADSVYVCMPCPEGTWGDGTTSECCPNGYERKTVGEACPAGYVEVSGGESCPAGYVERTFD